MMWNQQPAWQPVFKAPIPTKRKIFVSYHHGDQRRPGDQIWADDFSNRFCGDFDLLFDRSLKTPVGSDDLSYVNRIIREDYISGSSLTVVLCGINTWKRMCVD